MNPLAALDMLATEATALFESYLGGGAIGPDGVTLLAEGAPMFRSPSVETLPSESFLDAFRLSDGSDWTESDAE